MSLTSWLNVSNPLPQISSIFQESHEFPENPLHDLQIIAISLTPQSDYRFLTDTRREWVSSRIIPQSFTPQWVMSIEFPATMDTSPHFTQASCIFCAAGA
jgi:hypothetical protein